MVKNLTQPLDEKHAAELMAEMTKRENAEMERENAEDGNK